MNGNRDPMPGGQTRRRHERGASLVEMAIVLPLLLVLTASIVDLGWAFRTYQAVTNASREGARTGSRLPCYALLSQRQLLKADIEQAVIREAASSDVVITPAEITITPDPVGAGCAAAGAELRVTVAHPHQTFLGQLIGSGNMLLSPVIPGGNLMLRSSTAMAAFGTD
jgi:Flp pilus assembly protein TadG